MTQLARIVDAADAKEFMFAGNAYLTLRSEKTGTRYTYRVKKAPGREVWFVSTLYGSDNTSDYRYLGIIEEGWFKFTKKSDNMRASPQFIAFKWAYEHLTRRNHVPGQLELWHEGRCGRCGRLLTVPESIANGIGPECAKRTMKAEAA